MSEIKDRKYYERLRQEKCLSTPQIQALFEKTKAAYSRQKKVAIEAIDMDKVHKLASGFFAIAHIEYPTKYVFPAHLGVALEFKRPTQTGYFIQAARKKLQKRGIILHNLFAIGHKIATPAEIVDEFLKSNTRGCGHLAAMLSAVASVDWNDGMLDQLDHSKKELLSMAFKIADSAQGFLRAQDKEVEKISDRALANVMKLRSYVETPVFRDDLEKMGDLTRH